MSNDFISPLEAYTVKDFCKKHSISRSHFYKMLKDGKAPRCILLGTKRLITAAAITEWHRKMGESL